MTPIRLVFDSRLQRFTGEKEVEVRLDLGTKVWDVVCVLATLYPGLPGVLQDDGGSGKSRVAVLLERDGTQVDLRDEVYDDDVIKVTAGPAFEGWEGAH